MNLKLYIPVLYAAMLGFFGVAIAAKCFQSVDMLTMLLVCLGSQVLFALFAISELKSSEQISDADKRLWSGLLISCPLIFGILYLKKVRRKIYLY